MFLWAPAHLPSHRPHLGEGGGHVPKALVFVVKRWGRGLQPRSTEGARGEMTDTQSVHYMMIITVTGVSDGGLMMQSLIH